ncbi:MAG TPA: cutinase family protein [Kofleriaceae bacterium]
MKTLLALSMLSSSLVFGACVGPGDSDADVTSQAAITCAAVHIITTRASTEQPGEGITGALVDQIISSSTQTITRASTNYPATLNNYNSSSLQGIQNLSSQLTAEVQACPNEKIVLLGYSQGAHVSLDVLGGGQGGSLGTAVPPISSAIASHVVAVVTFGDPRHVTKQAFDLGTSTRNGLFPRSSTQLGVLSDFAPKIESFCDANDQFCDSGFSTQVHLTYLNRDQNAAATFVLGKIGG